MNLDKIIVGIICISVIKCLKLSPSPIANVRYGRQLALTCEADNEWDSISWRRASDVSYTFVFHKTDCETKENAEGQRAFCSKTMNKTTITLYDTKPKNSDTWECLAVYPGNEFQRERTKVYISDPSIDISNSTKVLYGQGADLVCTLDPGWSRCAWKSVQNDEEIFSITSCINITTTNYSLICNINIVTLHVDTPVHQEVFECAGYYFIGDETHSPKGKTMIFIYTEPPRVQILPSSDPTEFFSFKLLCIAIGQPIPTVVWKYENEEISRAVGENTIVFPKLNRTDSGNYSCEGISSYLGTTMKNTSHYILTVQYTPFARIKNLVVSCSDNVSIDCLIEEGMPTKYNLLRWEHRFNGTFIQNLNISDMQYFINHVTISDLGEYVCVVSNGVKDINGNVFIEGIGNLLASSCSPVIISLEDSLLQGILTLELRVISIPPVKEVRLLHNSNNATLSMNTETTYEYADIEHRIHNVSVLYPGQIIIVKTKEALNRNDTYIVSLYNYKTAATNRSIYISVRGEYIYKKETEEGAENDSVIVISCISVVAVAFIVFVVIIWMRKRKILKPGMSFRKSHKKFRLDDEGYDSSGKIDEGTCINPCEIDDQDERDGNNMESGHQKTASKELSSSTTDESNNADIQGFTSLIDSIGFKKGTALQKNEGVTATKLNDSDMSSDSGLARAESDNPQAQAAIAEHSSISDINGCDMVPDSDRTKGLTFFSERAESDNPKAQAAIAEHSSTSDEDIACKGSNFKPSKSSEGISEIHASRNQSFSTSDNGILLESEEESERSDKNISVEETTHL